VRRPANWQSQHGQYQNVSEVLREGTVLSGQLPVNRVRLVQAWIEIRRDDLMADWDLAVKGEAPFPIDPLR